MAGDDDGFGIFEDLEEDVPKARDVEPTKELVARGAFEPGSEDEALSAAGGVKIFSDRPFADAISGDLGDPSATVALGPPRPGGDSSSHPMNSEDQRDVFDAIADAGTTAAEILDNTVQTFSEATADAINSTGRAIESGTNVSAETAKLLATALFVVGAILAVNYISKDV